VSPDDVTNILMVASNAAGNARTKPTMALLRAYDESDVVETTILTYQIASHDPHMTFELLKAAVLDAYESGQLEKAINHYADFFDAPVLRNVTMTPPKVNDPQASIDTGDDHSTLSGGEIAGIVIGIALFLVLCVLIASYYRRKHHPAASTTHYDATRGQSPVHGYA
jgi:hypothetical protein